VSSAALTEIDLTSDLVRVLLRDQHPDLTDCPLALGARGWDNQLWRRSEDLAVRASHNETRVILDPSRNYIGRGQAAPGGQPMPPCAVTIA
jgi:hypothetical protein